MQAPPTCSEPSPAAITALAHRARLLILTGAWLGKERNVALGQGALNHLRALANGVGQKAADNDASAGGYQPPALFERAWPRLPVDIEYLTMAEVQEFLRAQGIELAADAVAHSQLDGVVQLEDGKLPGVVANDEHGATRADLADGSGVVVHGARPGGDAAIVAQVGAA